MGSMLISRGSAMMCDRFRDDQPDRSKALMPGGIQDRRDPRTDCSSYTVVRGPVRRAVARSIGRVSALSKLETASLALVLSVGECVNSRAEARSPGWADAGSCSARCATQRQRRTAAASSPRPNEPPSSACRPIPMRRSIAPGRRRPAIASSSTRV